MFGKRCQTAPFSKDQPAPDRRRPGRKPGHAGAFVREPDHVDEEAFAALSDCPDCGTPIEKVEDILQFVVDRLAPLSFALALAAGCGNGGAGGPSSAFDDLAVSSPDLAARPDAAIAPDDLASSAAADLAGAPADFAPDLAGAETQLPPTKRAELEAWIAAGYYKSWRCEPAPHDARPPGAHGRNRICSNEVLATSPGPGEFPVGAASVKELWGANGITGYAVAVRTRAGGGGANWYWYERSGNNVYADGHGVGLCVNCHVAAPRDLIFTVVR